MGDKRIGTGQRELSIQTLRKFDQKASQKRECVDINGIFEGEEAKRKGFYYKNL